MVIENLDNYKHIHMIGIGGVSMSAIAETLKLWGHKVTGSDLNRSELTDHLQETGIPVVIGHDFENAEIADLVIYTAAISEDDPEYTLAKAKEIPTVDRGTFVGYLTKRYNDAICISGTHGKTTTTSMIALCFLKAKKDPSIEVGAIVKEIGGNYRVGKSEFFILEACEYKANFLKSFPNAEVILNIDNDHLDYYKTFDNIIKTFNQYASLLEDKGVLVTNADDKNCLNLKNYTSATFITYGIENTEADFIAKNIVFDKNGFPEFEVYKKRNNSEDSESNYDLMGKIKLSIAGKHNVSNALATVAMCDYYGIDFNTMAEALIEFTGADRRLEYKGTMKNGSVPIFDDYAHHPTEIKATCSAIKNKKYKESWVIFQPHTYSRTKALLDDFADALSGFDHILLVDIYAAREKDVFGVSSKDLEEKIKALGKNALYVGDLGSAKSYLEGHVSNSDLVLTLGAGSITKLSEMIKE